MYIHIENQKVHAKSPIQKIGHLTFQKLWMLSRSLERDLNVIQVWIPEERY